MTRMARDAYGGGLPPILKAIVAAGGECLRINPQWRARVELLLDALDAAEKVEDLNLLTLGTHPLKGNRKGEWGMTVTKNWRITFRFEAGDAVEVDLEDYH